MRKRDHAALYSLTRPPKTGVLFTWAAGTDRYGITARSGALRPQPRSISATLQGMADIPARDLRNDVSAVLRRVEAGERLRVTVSGRPVAELMPLASRPHSMNWDAFVQGSQEWRADAGLARELADLLPESTDDIPFP